MTNTSFPFNQVNAFILRQVPVDMLRLEEALQSEEKAETYSWEVRYSELQLLQRIGKARILPLRAQVSPLLTLHQGGYGEVWRGKYRHGDVAVSISLKISFPPSKKKVVAVCALRLDKSRAAIARTPHAGEPEGLHA
jgi:hypothetical protein